MRKFYIAPSYEENTFRPMAEVRYIDEDGKSKLLDRSVLEPVEFKYLGKEFTEQDIKKINQINALLEKSNMPLMTLEEAEWLCFDPIKKDKNTQPEEIQRLAGFKVEKTITYLD